MPSFRPKETTNAIKTLVLMGTIFATIFIAITYLSTTIGIQPDVREAETVNSMMTRAIVGAGTPFYYIVQVTTAVILLLAANTGFTGFPRLASVLANDRFMPRHFADVGSRLAFNFGIIVLALLACVILAAFNGSVTNLVPLYTIGVFLAFTLSQSGMVRHWMRDRRPGWRHRAIINGTGAVATGVVTVVIGATKFTHGAWIVVLVIPTLVATFMAMRRHYDDVAEQLSLEGLAAPPELRHTAICIVEWCAPCSTRKRWRRRTSPCAPSSSRRIPPGPRSWRRSGRAGASACRW